MIALLLRIQILVEFYPSAPQRTLRTRGQPNTQSPNFQLPEAVSEVSLLLLLPACPRSHEVDDSRRFLTDSPLAPLESNSHHWLPQIHCALRRTPADIGDNWSTQKQS